MSVLSNPYFHNEEAAFEHVEKALWANGPVCPHCGSLGQHYDLKKTRIGLRKCQDCRKQFTVRVGTVFESSHVPLHKWLQAVYLMRASKKGVSAHQLHRILQVTYKTAWFMAHRIREAMRDGTFTPMGGAGSVVEADETYIGRLKGQPKRKSGFGHKNTVLTLVERGGRARSFHVDNASVANVVPIVRENIACEAELMTDEATVYKRVGAEFASHDTVRPGADEYVRYEGERTIRTNTVEGYYSVFKRGMKGVYQHCGEKHLHRYLAEFDFRYNNRVALGVNDGERADKRP